MQDAHATIADNMLHFGRVLRVAGLPITPQQTADAIDATLAVGISSRSRFYWALHTAFVKRRSEHELFEQAFAIFWRDPGYLKRMMSLMIPQTSAPPMPEQQKNLARRLSDALGDLGSNEPKPQPDELEIDAVETFSNQQQDRTKDFAQMTADELRQASAEVQRIKFVTETKPTRRFSASSSGSSVDLRRMLREAGSKGSDHLLLKRRKRRHRQPPLVVLCDISGSMEQYARVFLHFLYGLSSHHDRVSCFLFATRLYDISRKLKSKDPDVAIASVGNDVTDWSGGTRIGQCLTEFNQRWARRVLGQNANVLLFTDGLDRDAGEGMELAARRLATSCKRLIWINPLLRYDKYQPIASGARILDTYASETRSCHNIESLSDLAVALNGGTGQHTRSRSAA